MKPLVSIIIPAFNAEKCLAEAIQSAVGQTWPRKEVIIVNDGSTDRTLEIARRFSSKDVTVLSTENRGLSAAVNHGYRYCQGDYIQELDSDDILATNKIERQLSHLRLSDSRRILLSCAWGPFFYRPRPTRLIRNSLCQDLSPVEWLVRKMGDNLHMQNATWLVSRELADTAGPWDESLEYDQDGEYFDRVLLAAEGTRFVSGTGIFYRVGPTSRISYIGNSDRKKESLFRSIKLHIQYIRSLEDSERVRKVCVTYLQNWYGAFHPDRLDIVGEMEALAKGLGGSVAPPDLDWKYAWMEPVLGTKSVKAFQRFVGEVKMSCLRGMDKTVYELTKRQEPMTYYES